VTLSTSTSQSLDVSATPALDRLKVVRSENRYEVPFTAVKTRAHRGERLATVSR
jgi:hypothetical protein